MSRNAAPSGVCQNCPTGTEETGQRLMRIPRRAQKSCTRVVGHKARRRYPVCTSQGTHRAREITEGRGKVKLQDKIKILKSAGFPIRFVERSEWAPYPAPVGTMTVRETHPRYVSYSDVHERPTQFPCRAFADLGSIARGEDTAGQTSTVDRSNYRSLRRDFPEMFTDTSYANVDSLGAFIGNLSDDVTETLVSLRTEYPLYDESDLSELESEEISDSWDAYVSWDLASEIRKAMSDEGDSWDAMSDDAQRAMFWDAVEATESYPEHDGLDVRWEYDAIVTEIAEKLGVFLMLPA